MKTIAVSGGFDPLHLGHLQMFEEARAMGDRLVVILNCDAWLVRKKGYAFMPALQRASIIGALACVDEVYIHESEDDHVCHALEVVRPDVFANGGDRKVENTPEVKLCAELGIEMAFNIGGGKIELSSELVKKAMAHVMFTRKIEHRPWGAFMLYAHGENYWIKKLQIKPGGRTSLQSHQKRMEVWLCVSGSIVADKDGEKWPIVTGETLEIGAGLVHRISSKEGAEIIELGYGDCDENDIERFEDDYGRAN